MEEKETKKLSAQELHEAEMRKLELEAKKLEIAEKQANVQDLKERLAEREIKRELRFQVHKTNGDTLKQLKRADDAVQKRCNHKKGGNGAFGVVAGQGDSSQYAVLKHIFSNGDMWVRCLRCGKTWKPVFREDFATDEGYLGAVAEYEAAKNFPTKNVASGSVIFQWSDNGETYRRALKNSTLR